jgi:single-strand DNA-binding protein
LRSKLNGKPKDFGIMDLLVPHKSTLRDLFRFLLVLPLCPLCSAAFFFPFFFWKNDFQNKTAQDLQGNSSNAKPSSSAGKQGKYNNFFTLKQTSMIIIGRLTRDAQVRTLDNGKEVVSFSVAVNDSYKDKAGERKELTEYFNCAYWISMGVAKVLTKGALVELTGRVSASAWNGKDGKLHAGLNFHTSNIKLHGGGKRTDTEQAAIKTENVATVQEQETADDLPF